MPSTLHGPRRIVIDHELLGRLRPDSPRQTWIDTLRRAGLSELPTSGANLPMLEELGRAVGALPSTGSAAPAQARRGFPLTQGVGIVLVVLGLLVPIADISESPGLLGLWVAVVVGFLVAAAFELRGRAGVSEKPGVTAPDAGARAYDALRRVRSTSFVTASGTMILENTPHRTWFDLRAEALSTAERQVQDRIDEIVATRARIREVNRRLGRPEDDAETEQLGRAIATEEAGRARIREVSAHLIARQKAYNARLDELRVLAERRVLSETVGRLTEGASENAARAAALVEVDVLETEREIRALDDRILHEDARLAAVLELVGLGR